MVGFSDIRRGHVVCIMGPMFSGKTVTADGATLIARTLREIRAELFALETEVIAIDEGQFLRLQKLQELHSHTTCFAIQFDDLSYTCEQLACEGKLVLPFVEVSQLISFSDEIKKLSAVCMDCGDDAPFTFRCTNEREVEVIGGEDTYRALCRTCYYTRSIEKDCKRSRRG
ncbi:thymidine kinase [Ostertagia ostertagi]